MAAHLVHHSPANDDVVEWVGALLDLVQNILEHLIRGFWGGGGGVFLLVQVGLGQVWVAVVIVIRVRVKSGWARSMGVGHLQAEDTVV